ncbi:MAG: hypothetical protein ABJA82_15770 [Myxococcales bacterium]
MHETVIALLDVWRHRLATQDKAVAGDTDSPSIKDVYLDRHLYGAALFLQEVAHKLRDAELLGLCTMIERDLSDRFEAESKAYADHEREVEREAMAREEVRAICVRYFFKERLFKVDLSKYLAMIDACASHVRDAAELKKLRRYVDEEQCLGRIHSQVKNHFLHRTPMADPRPPSFEEVKAEFERTLAEVIRRADKHVSETLDRLCQSAPEELGSK